MQSLQVCVGVSCRQRRGESLYLTTSAERRVALPHQVSGEASGSASPRPKAWLLHSAGACLKADVSSAASVASGASSSASATDAS
eukprot:CAMPEP_0183356026 /NCGR_PEP_ID=MMETSP0164_2-20130417/42774_1 /TAXON_ID=221442 /ORGANISM="Coccolithus pelagicus ssp braarudi, Strain PLY182g" /LENGTH=84 /DNA_ID=CAMNT_0025529309 /DNA_START=485 /DNA_END=735 /DNA_ORIENTATION=+